jgi:hypothetical protein
MSQSSTTTLQFVDSGELPHFFYPSTLLCFMPGSPWSSTPVFFETVLLAPQTTPFVGPDQAALEALLATFEPAEAM